MLPGYICMEKIIILWSDCESWGGKRPSCPLAQPPLKMIYISKLWYSCCSHRFLLQSLNFVAFIDISTTFSSKPGILTSKYFRRDFTALLE